MAKGYKAVVTEASFEISKKESISYAQLNDTQSIAELTENEALLITAPEYVIVHVTNPDAKEGKSIEYGVYLLIDSETKEVYQTSSDNLFDEFLSIKELMGDDKDWTLKVFQKPSTNYKGKNFLTCTVI